MKYLIFDTTNILYRTFYAHAKEDDQTIAGFAIHTALLSINKYFKEHRPDKVVMCFDRLSWRALYTQDGTLCQSGKQYKANRRLKMTPDQKAKYKIFQQHVFDFENLIRTKTSVIALAAKYLECDDLIAGFTQSHPDDIHVIVSADKDFVQLISSNVTLIDPMTGNHRECDDVKWYMFEKCIRGDTSDNVQSAYPRVLKTRLLRAYNDSYEYANLMKETWTNQDGKVHCVEDLFQENKLLMDLAAQPVEIRSIIDSTIKEGTTDVGTFNYFVFLKYLGEHELVNIKNSFENFVPMLSS